MTEKHETTKLPLGTLHVVEPSEHAVLIFQLSLDSRYITPDVIDSAQRTIKDRLPPGRKAIIIGSEVNVYELAGPDAIALILKGII